MRRVVRRLGCQRHASSWSYPWAREFLSRFLAWLKLQQNLGVSSCFVSFCDAFHHSHPAHGVSPAKQSLSSACWERSYMCVRLVSYDFLWVRTLIESSLLGDRPVGDLSRHARACDAFPRKRFVFPFSSNLFFNLLFSMHVSWRIKISFENLKTHSSYIIF